MKIVRQDREGFLNKSKTGRGRGERKRRDGKTARIILKVMAKPGRWFNITEDYRNRDDARSSIVGHVGTCIAPFDVRTRDGQTYVRYRENKEMRATKQ